MDIQKTIAWSPLIITRLFVVTVFLVLAAGALNTARAQTGTLAGTITSADEPIPGVNVPPSDTYASRAECFLCALLPRRGQHHDSMGIQIGVIPEVAPSRS